MVISGPMRNEYCESYLYKCIYVSSVKRFPPDIFFQKRVYNHEEHTPNLISNTYHGPTCQDMTLSYKTPQEVSPMTFSLVVRPSWGELPQGMGDPPLSMRREWLKGREPTLLQTPPGYTSDFSTSDVTLFLMHCLNVGPSEPAGYSVCTRPQGRNSLSTCISRYL